MSTEPAAPDPPPSAEESHHTKGLLRLTMACNERCPFCNVPVEDYPRPTPPLAVVQQELEAFAETGEQTLVISGGEPTLLRRRLVDLIRDARAKGIPFVELQTNAVLIDPDYAAAMREAGLTSAFVSLLSHVPAHHDELAGLEGAFDRCLAGIDALLDRGVRVTLNPVIAQQTQTLVPAYVDYIAERFPRIRSISLSSVQPHGRAATQPELMPQYDVLALHVRAARVRAAIHGISLINPYCGLPLCIGWEDGMDASVEAIEAAVASHAPPGLDNTGNKAQLGVCRRCVLRTRCGGAWHAYWQHRDGAGIRPPMVSVLPWIEGAADAPGQTVVRAAGGISATALEAVAQASTPTVWVWTDQLSTGDSARLLGTGCTDLAVDLDLSQPHAERDAIRELRRLQRAAGLTSPQRRLRLHLGWSSVPAKPSATECQSAFALAAALGATTLFVPVRDWGASTPAFKRLQADHPDLDVVTSG